MVPTLSKESVTEKTAAKVEVRLEESSKPTPKEEAIDFSALAKKAKLFLKSLKTKEHHLRENKEEEISFDFQKISSFARTNAAWILPLLFIILALSFSTYYRMMPAYLPVTEEWAQDTVQNYYQNQIEQQVSLQYPNLPQQNKNLLVQRDFQNYLKQNQAQIDSQVAQLAQQYKAYFQDENGDTYLLTIDPYLWYSQAKNVLNYGILGDKIINGKSYFSLRDGRLGKKSSPQLNPWVGAYLYKFLSFFDKDYTLMGAMFLLPVLLINLAIIPAFFIGRKIAGNAGGLFAAIFLAINGPLLSRTAGGSADTDPYNVLFPLFIAWVFLEAYTSKKLIKQGLLAALAGLLTGFYAFAWNGWPHMFLFILGTLMVTLGFGWIQSWRENKKQFWDSLAKKAKPLAVLTSVYLVSTGIFVSLLVNWHNFSASFTRPLRFIYLKEVGIKTIWPNVLTTVAEFNAIPLSDIVSQVGGSLLFWLSWMGLVFLLFDKKKKDYWNWSYLAGAAIYCILVLGFKGQLNNPTWFIAAVSLPVVVGIIKVVYLKEELDLLLPILLTIWFVGASYAFTKGVRFAILLAPPFALGLGSSFGTMYQEISSWLSRSLHLDLSASKALVLLVLSLAVITPLSSAGQISKLQIPSINDAWHDALIKIKGDSQDALITSWWDFGHWFIAIAERKVTFDGGDQGERLHWVGKTLQTSSEKEAIGVLRMLNCAQETASHKLDEFTGDSLKSIKILYQVFPLLERNKALQKYQELGLSKTQAEEMLEYTHCQDLIPNYYITSDDMVGKAGVWGHFGSWDFEKATMYQNANRMAPAEGIAYLQKQFGLSEEEASRTYDEIKNTEGDQWISPWPRYLSDPRPCDYSSKNELRCVGNLQGGTISIKVNLTTLNTSIENNPDLNVDKIVYATKTGVEEKEQAGKKAGFSLVLIPREEGYNFLLADTLQAGSMFTRLYFLEGHGLSCFRKFDETKGLNGARVLTWKIDYDCQQENLVYFLPKEEVHAAHLLITTAERSEQEALSLIESIRENVTSSNFEDYARKYSEDPGTAQKGGDLGWFTRGKMVPEFEQAAFSLNESQISLPVKTSYGYHLIQVLGKRIS